MANFLAEDQDSPVGGMGALFPPLPAHETRSTSESGSSTPVATPEYQQAISDVNTTNNAQADALEAKGLHDAQVAEALKKEAADQLAEMDRVRAEKAAESARQADNIKAQADVLRKANQELRAAPAPALFHEGDGWKNVAKAVALAVGAFGDALAAKGAALGGRSPSQNSVAQTVNLLLDQEREKIKKLTDNQVMAKTGLKDAMDARAMALAEIDARGAEAMRRAQMLGDYMVKAAGPEGAVLQSRLDALGLQQHMNEFRAQSLAALHKTVTSRHTTENVDRDQGTKPPNPNGLPTEFISDGVKYSVNPAETNAHQHAQARPQIAQQAAGLENVREVLERFPEGKGAPTSFGFITGDKERATVESKLSVARTAMAKSMSESMGESAAKERADEVFPHVPRTDMGVPQWKARIEEGYKALAKLHSETLHTAGAHAAGRAAPEATVAPAAPAPAAKSSAPAGNRPSLDDLAKEHGL